MTRTGSPSCFKKQEVVHNISDTENKRKDDYGKDGVDKQEFRR